MKKKVVYTVITNKKDSLQPFNQNPEWDYVCFTDNTKIKNKHRWQLVYLECNGTSHRRCSRQPKMLPHKYFPHYEYSIYLDGCVELQCDPEELLSFLGENDMALFKHRDRDCIYDEANEVKDLEKDTELIVNKTIEKYKEENYPEHNGLVDGKVIVRHHTEKIKLFNEYWNKIYCNYSKRDQLSFNYVSWKTKTPYSTITGDPYLHNSYVKKHKHEK